VLELRLDPEDAARAARLGVRAVLTVISGEGTSAERIARAEIGFRDKKGKPSVRVEARFDGGKLTITHRARGEQP
jgi:hypothetical protein